MSGSMLVCAIVRDLGQKRPVSVKIKPGRLEVKQAEGNHLQTQVWVNWTDSWLKHTYTHAQVEHNADRTISKPAWHVLAHCLKCVYLNRVTCCWLPG